MENIVKQILESTDMAVCAKQIVEKQSYDDNVVLYGELAYALFDIEDNDPKLEVLNKVLDSMNKFAW